MEIIVGILVGLVMILSFTTYNLFSKNEKQENIIYEQNQLIEAIQILISESNDKLEEIDERGVFKSDDEIGWFFNGIKSIQKLLNQFINK